MSREIDEKILEEIKKPGREPLYDLRHADYKNTTVKRIMWNGVAEVVRVTIEICKTRWKILRAKYVNQNKPPKSGSAAPPKKDEWLNRSMDFLKDIVIPEQTYSSFQLEPESQNLFQSLFDETASSISLEVDNESSDTLQLFSETALQATPKAGPSRKRKNDQNPMDPLVHSVMKSMDAHRKLIEGSTAQPTPVVVPLAKQLMVLFQINKYMEEAKQ